MMTGKKPTEEKNKPLTAVEIGRYLKRLSGLYKNPDTGNPALSIALQELAKILIDSKQKSVREVFNSGLKQLELDVDETAATSNGALSLLEISELLEIPELPRTKLIAIGAHRFGIPVSKMKKLSKEDVTKSIRSALEHEQSIEILSDEASRGGKTRTS